MSSTTARRRSPACALGAVLALAATLVWVRPADAMSPEVVPGTASIAQHRGGGTGCLVPELRGLRLRVAKAELEWANCSLGSVRTKRAAAWKRGYVLKQSVPADSVRRAGYPVKVVVGR
jgi:beta-lactam-binding protein with PASTA domain